MASTTQALSRMEFLRSTAHAYAATNPALASHLMREFSRIASASRVSLPEDVQRQYCSYCGAIFLPGTWQLVPKQKAANGRKIQAYSIIKHGETTEKVSRKMPLIQCRVCRKAHCYTGDEKEKKKGKVMTLRESEASSVKATTSTPSR